MTNNDTAAEYIPSDEAVRDAYAEGSHMMWEPVEDEGGRDPYRAQFDRWLIEHDLRVKAEAWAEGAYAGYDDCKYDGDTPNPYSPGDQ